MMGGWGPRTPEELKQAQEDARISYAVQLAMKKVAELEARLAMKNRLIVILRDFIKKQFASLEEENSVPELIGELLELTDE